MKSKLLNKVFSLLIVVAMVLSMCPTFVFADGADASEVNLDPDGNGCPHCEGEVEWLAWDAAGVAAGGHYKLTANVSRTSAITIAANADTVVDLAGFNITAKAKASTSGDYRVFTISTGATLSILDSTAKEEDGTYTSGVISGGYIYDGTKGYDGPKGGNISVAEGATFNLYSGAIKNGKAAGNAQASHRFGGNVYGYPGSEINMYGGEISGGRIMQASYLNSSNDYGYHGGCNIGSFGDVNIYGGVVKDGLLDNWTPTDNYKSNGIAGGNISVFAGKGLDGEVNSLHIENATVTGGHLLNDRETKATGSCSDYAYGGNIYAKGVEVTIKDATITDGKAEAIPTRAVAHSDSDTNYAYGGNIYVVSGNLTISGNTTISGGEATASGLMPDGITATTISNGACGGNIFVSSGNLVISDSTTISGGSATAHTRLQGNNGTGKLSNSAYGGNIYVSGNLTVSGSSEITGGNATAKVSLPDGTTTGAIANNAHGGGIYVKNGDAEISGSAVVSDSNAYAVSEVTAAEVTTGITTKDMDNYGYGGGIYVSAGSLTLSDSVCFSGSLSKGEAKLMTGVTTGDKSSTGYGGNIFTSGTSSKTLTIGENVQILDGISSYCGGNIYVASMKTELWGTVTGGQALSYRGGNIYQSGGTMNMRGGLIANGVAKNRGGNYFMPGGTFNMYGGQIIGQTEGATVAADEYSNGIVANDATLNIYGGTINSNRKTPAIFLLYADLNMYGGTLLSNAGNVVNTYNSTAGDCIITVYGGTLDGNVKIDTGVKVAATETTEEKIYWGKLYQYGGYIDSYSVASDSYTEIKSYNGTVGSLKTAYIADCACVKDNGDGTYTIWQHKVDENGLCADCGHTYKAETVCTVCNQIHVPAEGGAHTWELDSTTATCTEDGVNTYKCASCGATKEEAQAAFGHEYDTETGICKNGCNELAEAKVTLDGNVSYYSSALDALVAANGTGANVCFLKTVTVKMTNTFKKTNVLSNVTLSTAPGVTFKDNSGFSSGAWYVEDITFAENSTFDVNGYLHFVGGSVNNIYGNVTTYMIGMNGDSTLNIYGDQGGYLRNTGNLFFTDNGKDGSKLNIYGNGSDEPVLLANEDAVDYAIANYTGHLYIENATISIGILALRKDLNKTSDYKPGLTAVNSTIIIRGTSGSSSVSPDHSVTISADSAGIILDNSSIQMPGTMNLAADAVITLKNGSSITSVTGDLQNGNIVVAEGFDGCVWYEEGAYTVKAHNASDATCTEDGKCTNCGAVITEAPGHTLTKTEAEPSSCTKAGHAAYWYCTVCEKYFADADATKVIEDLTTWLAEGGEGYDAMDDHDHQEIVKPENLVSAATCQAAAVYNKSCSVCGEKSEETFSYGEVDKNNHVEVKTVDAKAATCLEAGWNAYEYCTKCDYTTKVEQPKLEHNYTYKNNGDKTHTVTCDKGCNHSEILPCADTNKDHFCDDCGAKLMEPVATVNGVEYGTLEEAIAADGEVVLVADITVAASGLTIATTEIINLNGKTLTSTGDIFVVVAGGDLTINGNGFVKAGTDNAGTASAVYVNGGKLTINGGTYSCGGDTETTDVKHQNDMIYVKGGSAEIYGGYFALTENVWALNISDSVGGTLKVYGGEFEGYDPANNVSRDNYLADQTKHTKKVGNVYSICENTHTGNYTEATFEADAYTTYTCVCGDTYTVTHEGTKKTAVATVNGQKFETLAEALAADGEVVLVADITVVASGLTIATTEIINLNGKTLTSTGDIFVVVAGGDLTINGNGFVKAGTDNAGTASAVYVNGGKLTINGGTYSCGGDTETTDVKHQNDLIYVKGGSAEIYGGYFALTENVWALNISDSVGGTLKVYGGEFEGYDPAENVSRDNYLADQTKHTKKVGNVYSICENTHTGNYTEATFEADAYTTYTCVCGDTYTVTHEGTKKTAVATVNGQKFETLAEALAADGEVVLVADIDATASGVIVAAGETIDLNGCKLTADIIGVTIKMNGGTFATSEYLMVGATEGKYTSTDAVFTIAPNATMDMTFTSGTITLNETLWYTMEGQTLTIAEAATFVIPAGKTLYVNGSKVVVNGTAANFGTLILANGAHLKGDVAGTFQMAGGTFETSKYVMIGATQGKYLSTDAIFTILPNATMDMVVVSGTITLNDPDWWTLQGQTLTIAEAAKFVVPAGKNINVQGTVIVEGTAVTEGTVTLYNENATVKAAEGLNVVVNSAAGDTFLYEDGTYKVHSHSYSTVVTDPTCTEKGYTTYTCVCGDEYIDNYVDETGHSYTSEYHAATNTENAYTVYTCHCGDTYTVVEEGTMLHFAINEATGESYADLQEALDAAAKGQTVKLLKDVEAEDIYVGSGKILDLNGKKLTINSTISASFTTTHIIDSSNSEGLLILAEDAEVALNAKNEQLPVWTAEGVKFAKVGYAQIVRDVAGDANAKKYSFYFTMDADDTILDTVFADSNNTITIRVKVNYTTASNMNAYQYFELTEGMENEYGIDWSDAQVNLILRGAAGLQNLTFTAEIVSTAPNGTSVVIGSTPLSV